MGPIHRANFSSDQCLNQSLHQWPEIRTRLACTGFNPQSHVHVCPSPKNSTRSILGPKNSTRSILGPGAVKCHLEKTATGTVTIFVSAVKCHPDSRSYQTCLGSNHLGQKFFKNFRKMKNGFLIRGTKMANILHFLYGTSTNDSGTFFCLFFRHSVPLCHCAIDFLLLVSKCATVTYTM